MPDNEVLSHYVKEAQKDISNFDEVYERIVNKVFFWAYNSVGNREVAKDLTQDVMINVAQSINTLEDPENFVVWTYVITKNVCKNYFRDNQNAARVILATDESYDYVISNIEEERAQFQPERKLNEKIRDELVVNFVDNLPRRQREVVTLFYLEQFSVSEISEALDLNESTIKSNLFSGRKALEKQITSYQTNNGIRLYDKSIFLILGSILLRYREIICQNVNLEYDKDAIIGGLLNRNQKDPKNTNDRSESESKSWFSEHIPLLISGAVIASLLVSGAVIANTLLKKEDNSTVRRKKMVMTSLWGTTIRQLLN